MSSASASKSASAGASKNSRSKATPSKIAVLKLAKDKLVQFPHEGGESKAASSNSPSASSMQDPTAAAVKDSTPAADSVAEVKTEGNNDDKNSNSGDGKKKGGVKAGTKRSASALGDGQPKSRAKPGPKKRKLDGVNGDESNRPWTTPQTTGAGHKLGPKANQGAINAGLRALDRTGTPCRKWHRTGFKLKSFTGVVWTVPTWGAPKRPEKDDDDGSQAGSPESSKADGAGSASGKDGGNKSTNGENKENETLKIKGEEVGSNVPSEAGGKTPAAGEGNDVKASPAPVAASA